MKGLSQLPALHSRMPILAIEFKILSRIVGFRWRGHRGGSSQHGMLSHVHKDAPEISGEAGVDDLELRPPISAPHVSANRGLNFLGSVHTFRADLCGSNKVSDLPQCLC